MKTPHRALGIAAVVCLLATACGSPATAETRTPQTAAPTTTLVTTTTAPTPTIVPTTTEPVKCPVTMPPKSGFTPPKPHPADHPAEDLAWFGGEGLWTALSLDGEHGPRKAAFWSVNFPGGTEEERPDLTVTWTRLDTKAPIVHDNHDATNAYTVEEGWYMLGGIDPDEPGCWRVDASYKGATLSYVYER